MKRFLQKQWLSFSAWQVLLWPPSLFFAGLVALRKCLYRHRVFKTTRLSVPLIVVGNISLGGTGKTPMVIWLAEQLRLAGFKPGIISRGYGGVPQGAVAVFADSPPALVGDEPVLIAKRSACPVFVGVDKVRVGQALLQANPQCDVIISDDGLQHYAMERDVEVALLDGFSQFGNRCLLPAGPLREGVSRLNSVDAVVVSGGVLVDLPEIMPSRLFAMSLEGDHFFSLDQVPSSKPASYFFDKNIVAVAGIANPQRFFNKLTALGLQFEPRAFADHHVFSAAELTEFANKTILMTEKDAVKCLGFTDVDVWYLPVTATISSATGHSLISLILQKLRN